MNVNNEYLEKYLDHKFGSLESRMKTVETKLDLLFAFKWQIIGGSLVLSTIVSIMIAGMSFYLGKV